LETSKRKEFMANALVTLYRSIFVPDYFEKSCVGCVLRTINPDEWRSAAAAPPGRSYSLYRRMMMIPNARQTTP
jgi:hypothetical protein